MTERKQYHRPINAKQFEEDANRIVQFINSGNLQLTVQQIFYHFKKHHTANEPRMAFMRVIGAVRYLADTKKINVVSVDEDGRPIVRALDK